jgi:hypothetical protein
MICINVPGFNTFCEFYSSDSLFRQIFVELSEGGK